MNQFEVSGGPKSGGGSVLANVRVWIVEAAAWSPATVFDEPAASTVLFPALERCVTPPEAAEFVAGFNEQMLDHGGRRWAIARLVTVRADEVLAPPVGLVMPGGHGTNGESGSFPADVGDWLGPMEQPVPGAVK